MNRPARAKRNRLPDPFGIEAEIAVYCDDPSHDNVMVTVQSFVLVTASGRMMWLPRRARGRDRRRMDIPPDSDEQRYKLACRCRAARVVRRDKLVPILDDLAVRGESRISLRDLAARLGPPT